MIDHESDLDRPISCRIMHGGRWKRMERLPRGYGKIEFGPEPNRAWGLRTLREAEADELKGEERKTNLR